jgi:AcrR family transcriptional regulator
MSDPPGVINPARPRLTDRKRSSVRNAILNAAEQLIRQNHPADFSMRELCNRADVSFTTPFNHFGSKNGIKRGLIMRTFDRLNERYELYPPSGDAIDRVLATGNLAIKVWLENCDLHRLITPSLVSADAQCHDQGLFAPACAIWAGALGDCDGFDDALVPVARNVLPGQLAATFRGIVTLWVADEIAQDEFAPMVQSGIAILLLAFASPSRRVDLRRLLA